MEAKVIDRKKLKISGRDKRSIFIKGIKTPSAYDRFMKFQGLHNSGINMGKTLKWHYGKGVWKDRKVNEDEWSFKYEVLKNRTGDSFKSSGAPVGTECRWLIIADQYVEKLDESTYYTRMDGMKLKIAHKSVKDNKWDISGRDQKERLISMLKKFVSKLEAELESD